jgi:rhodanese-related sulfurtransferase
VNCFPSQGRVKFGKGAWRMVTRRLFFGIGIAAIAAGAVAYGQVYPAYDGPEIDPPEAARRVAAGDVTLVDIRRPDEWAATGSGAGALQIDMRRDDFVAALTTAVGGNRDAPVALICARGVRSARLANQLAAAGFTNIINVPEGMEGSSAGPGWIARGLPMATD